jgi:hypothetical protein
MIRLGSDQLHGSLRFGILADGLSVGVDVYPPRLQCLRHFADEIDPKQAVLIVRFHSGVKS